MVKRMIKEAYFKARSHQLPMFLRQPKSKRSKLRDMMETA
jgi:hypothetical protein